MARYTGVLTSQAAMPAGLNATTTVNGYVGCLVGSATSGFRLRRLTLGVRAGASVPTSQQVSVALHRQTVTPSGTGLTTTAGSPLETYVPQTDPAGGSIVTTAATIGTTGPTITTTPLRVETFNTQSTVDLPFELLEEMTVAIGAANGLAFVNTANALPASHVYVITYEIEV